MQGWLKADLHTHTKEDIIDYNIISYTTDMLMQMAKNRGFDVIAVTNHRKPTVTAEMIERAQNLGMVLLPGVEAEIESRHVLVIAPGLPVPVPKRFEDLEAIGRDGCLVIAPHPFFPPPTSLRSMLEQYIQSFNAIEFSHFYTTWANLNHKAVKMAREHGLPIVGTSDMHHKIQMDSTYTMIEASKEPQDIINAVKQNRIKLVTKPLSNREYLSRAALKSIKMMFYDIPRSFFIKDKWS